MRAEDRDGKTVILFTTEWDLRYAEENANDVEFSDVAFPAS
jgi:peptide subunit release factor RF-3